jgi:hypothetical protein
MNWVLIDRIKRGIIEYKKGDAVILFRRKGKNPKKIFFDKTYYVFEIENDKLFLVESLDYKSYPPLAIAIHKTYMIHPWYLRNFKIEMIQK